MHYFESDPNVYRQNVANDRLMWPCFIVALAALAIQVVMILAYNRNTIALSHIAIVHLIILAFIGAWTVFLKAQGAHIRLFLLFCIYFGISGPFGSAITCVAILFYAYYRDHHQDFDEWYHTMFPDEAHDSSQKLYERLIYGWDDFSEKGEELPFMDVMDLGTIEQKQFVLEKISRYFTAQFSPLLMKALDDSSNVIRVQAATIMSKLEEDFTHTLIEFEKDLEETPDDYDLLYDLGQFCDAYSFTGILDVDRARELREKAIEHYERCIDLNPDSPKLYFLLGRAYLRNKQPRKAFEYIKVYIQQHDPKTPYAVLWYMECLFYLKQFDELQQFSAEHLDCLTPEDSRAMNADNLIKMWAGGISNTKIGEA